jgi:hypothetical protein
MFLERLTLTNFQCFAPEPTTIRFDTQLTAMLGGNAAGKTAACQALSRLFSVVDDQRQIRAEDFHIPDDEKEGPATRALSIEGLRLMRRGLARWTATRALATFRSLLSFAVADGRVTVNVAVAAKAPTGGQARREGRFLDLDEVVALAQACRGPTRS